MIYLLSIGMCLVSFVSVGQVNGNKKIETKTYDFKDISTFEMRFPAKVVIDASQDADFMITTDENIFDNMDISFKDGKVKIDQAKWIEASQMTIKFGSKSFTKLITSGYGNFEVSNINAKTFTVINPVGTVKLQGKADDFVLKSKTGKTDATDLVVDNAMVNISSWGKATINASDYVKANTPNKGEITYTSEPNKVEVKGEGEVKSFSEVEHEQGKEPAIYIKLKVENNKILRQHFYIEGPKHRKFSYGFPLNPYQKREKTVPVGTKIYKVNKLGVRKLLVTITAEDASKVVKLFKD